MEDRAYLGCWPGAYGWLLDVAERVGRVVCAKLQSNVSHQAVVTTRIDDIVLRLMGPTGSSEPGLKRPPAALPKVFYGDRLFRQLQEPVFSSAERMSSASLLFGASSSAFFSCSDALAGWPTAMKLIPR